MGEKTGYQVRCRCGKYVPLLQKTKKNGEMGRFYFVHPQPIGCGQFDQFPPDIDNTDDLAEMVKDVSLKGPGVSSPAAKDVPLKDDGAAAAADDTPEPVKETVLKERSGGDDNGWGLGGW